MGILLTRLPATGRLEKQKSEDGTLESHFRGRKLKGKEISVPEGWRGAMVKDCGTFPQRNREHCDIEDGDEGEEGVEAKILEELGGFEEIVVWGHDSVVEPGEDMFGRGLEEWVGFSGAMHHFGGDEQSEKQAK